MVRYFKELEDKKNQYLNLLKTNYIKHYVLEQKVLPVEFYIKYKNLFDRLDEIDVLLKKQLDNGRKKLFWNDEIEPWYGVNEIINFYLSGFDISDSNITKEGKNRLDILVKDFENKYGSKKDHIDSLFEYIDAILDLFYLDGRIITNKDMVKRYLKCTLVVAKYQKKLLPNDEALIKAALAEIDKYTTTIPVNPYTPVEFNLPDAWYITPYNHLYNTMGKNGHKESNLIYPLYYYIIRDGENPNPESYLKTVRKIKKEGFITYSQYSDYLNFTYDFPSVYPDFYYSLDNIEKIKYDIENKRSYNSRLVNVILGIISAQAALYSFFYDLKLYSNDYERDLNFIKKMNLDDILVLCCGFHKISSVVDKTIVTSLVNYEDAFVEYIERGWKIQFIPPIIINKEKGILEEYPKEFLLTRDLLKNSSHFDNNILSWYYNQQLKGENIMAYQLKSVAMHITNECSHKCPMCYATPEGQIKCEGNIDVLKAIAKELRSAGVEEINLVGGDPAEYSKIKELVQYLYELGFKIPILSNTHDYSNSSVEEIAPYVISLESTIHAQKAEDHDKFCGKANAYNNVIEKLKRYSMVKSDEQQLGIVMNVMKHNYNSLYNMVESLLEKGLPVDYVLVQRIGAYGKALGSSKFSMSKEEIVVAFENIDKISRQLGIDINMVDAFPYCVVPEEYHKYLSKCDWGYGTAAIDMNGNLSRCALSSNYSLGNVLQTPVNEIWQNSPILEKFRSKEYLRQECRDCKSLEVCGGGCAMSCGNDELSSDSLVKTFKI